MPVQTGYSTGTPVAARQSFGTRPALPNEKRKEAFQIFAHPGQWMHEAGKGWFPLVKCVEARPGVNGATVGRDGNSIDAAGMTAGMVRTGWVQIVAGDRRLGQEFATPEQGGMGLMNKHDLRDGGSTFLPPWEALGVVAGKTRRAVDHDMYDRLRRAIGENVLGGMPREVLDDRLNILEGRITNLRGDRTGGPNIMKLLEKAEAQKAAWIKDWEDQFGEKKKEVASE